MSEPPRVCHCIPRCSPADYLEVDLRRTLDGILVAFHDESDLRRTTDVAGTFPQRADDPVERFVFADLQRLDAGVWFNKTYPQSAKPSYAGRRQRTNDVWTGVR